MDTPSRAWVVDDDEVFQFIMKRQIMSVDLLDEIELFSNGKEAIDELLTRRDQGLSLPEIIFLPCSRDFRRSHYS